MLQRFVCMDIFLQSFVYRCWIIWKREILKLLSKNHNLKSFFKNSYLRYTYSEILQKLSLIHFYHKRIFHPNKILTKDANSLNISLPDNCTQSTITTVLTLIHLAAFRSRTDRERCMAPSYHPCVLRTSIFRKREYLSEYFFISIFIFFFLFLFLHFISPTFTFDILSGRFPGQERTNSWIEKFFGGWFSYWRLFFVVQ